MSEPGLIPCLPESAPFTPEQRAYLNGFFAGVFSRVPARPGPASFAPAAQSLAPLTVLFGSQTGNAETLAKRIVKEAGRRGFAPTLHDLAKYACAQLPSEGRLLIVTSTFGDGEPPDNAKLFWEVLSAAAAPKLAQTRFSVCALGDSNYPKFCGFGKDLDARLQMLGAQRAHPCAECDVDFEEPFAQWLNGVLSALAATAATPASALGLETDATHHTKGREAGEPRPSVQGRASCVSQPAYSRGNPFPAALVTNHKLNAPGSGKDTRHFEVALDGSGLTYQVGDVLGVIPSNCPELIEDMLAALKFSGDEAVPGRDGAEVPVREALLRHYEITKIPQPFLKEMAGRSGDEALKKFSAPGANGDAAQFLRGREIIDLILGHPAVKFTPAEFVDLLKKLQARLYSISSSPKAHPGQVHLTVNIVRYESLARRRKGVCSTFLAERVGPSTPLPVFVQTNNHFRLPPSGDTPMIMVGPGTGIAPFRAFLEERRVAGAKGRNWLFFGDQHAATDFIYRDELEAMRRDGTLARLDTAFSRDQAQKLYVQQRMREQGPELFKWLEEGAHFYVCGDASRMAKDVDAALHEVIQTSGCRTCEQAAEYVSRLKTEKRYQRDVY